jgi:methyl acetate hydrolase
LLPQLEAPRVLEGFDAAGAPKLRPARRPIISDQSLEIYFRESIFAPLGMTDTGFLISSAQKKRVAQLYTRKADGSLAPGAFSPTHRPEFFMGGAGLFSTPRNYMAFLQMLLHDGTFNGRRF